MTIPISTTVLRVFSVALAAIVLSTATQVAAQGQGKFVVSKMAEKSVSSLPDGELFWHVETFASIDEAKAKEGEYSLSGEFDGKAWLFTLGGKNIEEAGGDPVATIGPVQRIDAPDVLLRVNNGIAPPGATTSIHSHPGTEAFLILSGQITQHTPFGMHVVNAGGTLPGVPDQTMQVKSTGDEELRELIMFMVDASRPFSEKKDRLY